MKKFALLFTISTIIYSCGPSFQAVGLKSRTTDGVMPGTITKDLGDPLIKTGTESYTNGIKINQSISEDVAVELGYIFKVDLKAGETLYLAGVKDSREFYFSDNILSPERYYKQGVSIDKQTGAKYIITSRGLDNYFHQKPYKFSYSESEYLKDKCDFCFKKELIYNGKSGNEIKIIYREFINEMARPAYTQSLTYDLSDGNIISFKGCKLEVISAKNTGIEYKILSTFNE